MRTIVWRFSCAALLLGLVLWTGGSVPCAWAQGEPQAQAPPPPEDQEQWVITFGAGTANPTGGWFSSDWKRGASILLALARQSGSKSEVGFEFGYNKFKPAGDSVAVPGITSGDRSWEMWRIRLRMRRFFASESAKLAPFAMAGIGIYPITVLSEDSTGTYKVTISGLGGSIGGGIDFRVGDAVHFGLEGQYHYVKTDEAQVTYKASPFTELVLAIRWLPG